MGIRKGAENIHYQKRVVTVVSNDAIVKQSELFDIAAKKLDKDGSCSNWTVKFIIFAVNKMLGAG